MTGSGLRTARIGFQILLTAGFLGLLAWRVDIGEAFSTFSDAQWAWLPAGLILFTLSKALHAARWRIFLGSHRSLPLSGLFGIFLIHNMVNAMLLLRAGDVVRIQTTAQRYKIARSELTATVVVVESVLDGLSFVLLVAVAFALGSIPGSLQAAFWTLAGLALLGFALSTIGARWIRPKGLVGFVPRGWLSEERRRGVVASLDRFLDGMRSLREWRLAAPAMVLSVAGWLLEAWSYWCFGQAFGLSLGFGGYLLIMMTANFVVSIPITPSGIGPYEVATQELLVLLGEERALAAGFAIGIHLSFIIWITITGLVAMWLMRLRPSDIFYVSQLAPAEAEPPPGNAGSSPESDVVPPAREAPP